MNGLSFFAGYLIIPVLFLLRSYFACQKKDKTDNKMLFELIAAELIWFGIWKIIF